MAIIQGKCYNHVPSCRSFQIKCVQIIRSTVDAPGNRLYEAYYDLLPAWEWHNGMLCQCYIHRWVCYFLHTHRQPHHAHSSQFLHCPLAWETTGQSRISAELSVWCSPYDQGNALWHWPSLGRASPTCTLDDATQMGVLCDGVCLVLQSHHPVKECFECIIYIRLHSGYIYIMHHIIKFNCKLLW